MEVIEIEDSEEEVEELKPTDKSNSLVVPHGTRWGNSRTLSGEWGERGKLFCRPRSVSVPCFRWPRCRKRGRPPRSTMPKT
eukprot:1448431-Rhodomonas_salina.1